MILPSVYLSMNVSLFNIFDCHDVTILVIFVFVFYQIYSLKEHFSSTPSGTIIGYLKETGLHSKVWTPFILKHCQIVYFRLNYCEAHIYTSLCIWRYTQFNVISLYKITRCFVTSIFSPYVRIKLFITFQIKRILMEKAMQNNKPSKENKLLNIKYWLKVIFTIVSKLYWMKI